MKIYEIRNKNIVFGYMFYSKEDNESYIELNNVDEQPVFFAQFTSKNRYTLNEYWTRSWIGERVIPYDRQNIGYILKENVMPVYNAYALFIKAQGKSSMDDNYLKPIKIDELSDFVSEKRKRLIKDFIKISNNNLIVFFQDGVTKMYNYDFKTNDEPFLSSFGNEIIFNSVYRISYEELYNGIEIPFKYDDLINYLNTNVLRNSDVEKLLNVSRQYVNTLSKNKLNTLDNGLFLLNDVKLYKNIP